MKKWFLVGYMGGMKMLYYVGEFAEYEQAKQAAITRYKLKNKNAIELESK